MGSSEDATGTGTASPTPESPTVRLPQTRAEVRARREALRHALVELEDALTRPAGHGAPFNRHVGAAVTRMRTVLGAHVRETEAEDGLLHQLEHDAPWLSGRVAQLRNEHERLLARADDLARRCDGAGDPEEIRTEALALLQALSRHRHQGTDLLYDAYMVDISAAD